MRLFRLDRVDDVTILDERAAPPPEAHERNIDNGVYQPEPGSPALRLRLDRGRPLGGRLLPGRGRDVGRRPAGGLAVTLRTADLGWARRMVASLGGAAVVDEPAELATEVAADARAALDRYRAEDDPAPAAG